MIEIRTPTPDDHPGMVRQVREAFGGDEYDDAAAAREFKVIEFDRFRIAYDTTAKRIVGTAGTWALEITLPGLVTTRMAGLSWVAVAPTHRRQGVMSRLLDAIDADVVERGEPLAGLHASEATIYERFGYAVATWDRDVKLDRRLVALRDRFLAPPGAVRLVAGDAETLVDELVPRWDRYRRTRVGELSRSEQWQRNLVERRGWSTTYALHDDGYCCWKIDPTWTRPVGHDLSVLEFVATTPEARDALLTTVLSMDLVGPVTFSGLPLDDPLPFQLTNARVATTTSIDDVLWLKVLDVAAAFAARRYGGDDELVIEVGDQRWSVGNGGCRKVRRRADLVVDPATLGALVLGGAEVSTLAAAGLVVGRNDEAVRRAQALLRTHPDPWCQTSF